MKHLKRLCRLAPMWLQGEITFDSLKASMNLAQKSILLVGGGSIFCDREDEEIFFQ